MNTFIRFHRFEIFNNIKKIICLFVIITFLKRLRNVVVVPFFELFGQEHNFET
jgi:hypothetical protein